MSLVLATIFALLAGGLRLIEHAPNIAAVGALAIWSGAYLPRRIGWIIPLLVMLITDSIIGFYNPFIMLAVYGCFAIGSWFGKLLARQREAGNIILAATGSSIIFFLVTNGAVWAFGSLYPKTIQGLVSCFFMAIPFFRNSLISDLGFSAAFFGVSETAIFIRRIIRKAKVSQIATTNQF